jgi:hypothetical protein
MKKTLLIFGAFLAFSATASQAGIPTVDEQVCPVGGEKFQTTGTVSCSSFGLTQDFYFLRPSSCDFVTKLPQCPTNKLPLYKEFSPAEVALLKDYMVTAEYFAVTHESRFYIAKVIDDFLVSKGSTRTMDFGYLLGGLQHDRENTEGQADYRQWVIDAATEELTKGSKEDAPFIRLIMAYTHYLGGQFDEASSHLKAVKDDPAIKDNKVGKSYVLRLEECVAAKDVKKCPSTDQVVRKEEQS